MQFSEQEDNSGTMEEVTEKKYTGTMEEVTEKKVTGR